MEMGLQDTIVGNIETASSFAHVTCNYKITPTDTLHYVNTVMILLCRELPMMNVCALTWFNKRLDIITSDLLANNLHIIT